MRYNPPPSWPKPPADWQPAPGWAPDLAWGPPPAGWQLWVLERGDSAYMGKGRIYGLGIVPGAGVLTNPVGVHVSALGLHVGKKKPDHLVIEWPAVTRLEVSGSESQRTNTKGAALTHRRGSGHFVDETTAFGARSNSVASTSVYMRAYGREVSLVLESASPAAVRSTFGPVIIHLEQTQQAQAPKHMPPALPAPDPVQQLEGLVRLRDSGVLAPHEFEAKKQAILRRL